ncbi:MAG: hypothetical protein B7Y35_05930 [Sphingomonadales bacterium 28-64-96]|nr:MAG: hypothetical protein B7Y35_05930 [Sphingomonadales bacterium 28-64-96]
MIEPPLFDLPPIASPATAAPTPAPNRGARQSRFGKDALNRYDTIDPRAVAALLPHLAPRTRFIEPCAGKGDLVRQLVAAGHKCSDAIDIAPRADGIRQMDALNRSWHAGNDLIITNPPYDWPVLSLMIPHFTERALLTWLLLEAAFMHTRRAGPLMQRCRKIVSIGRLKWAADTEHSSTKDYCWYQFGSTPSPGNTAQFYGRSWQKVGK